jgi:hypothetical protein
MTSKTKGNGDPVPSAAKQLEPTDKGIAIYHVVYREEGFEQAARMLFELVRRAEQTHPGKPRMLFLDIEGHRNEKGGYDHDMLELQTDFILGFLMPFLTEASMPLPGHVKNSKPQRSDLPDELNIQSPND